MIQGKKLRFLSLVLFGHKAQAGLYYDDASCNSKVALHCNPLLLNSAEYNDILNDAFKSAFTMVDKGIQAVGGPANGPSAQWSFPDAESRDLAARVFGTTENRERSVTRRYNIVKSM
jgi:hypothetical protein